MTTREKVIVGLMCATIAFGAYELLSSGSPEKKSLVVSENPTEELNKLVADISKKIAAKNSNKDNQYIIELATDNWTKDPFIQSLKPLTDKLVSETEKQESPVNMETPIGMVYSGFLEVGNVKLAIIDGIEYAEGDALETTGFYVQSITSRYVIIARIDGSETVRLHLREIAN